ncbi:MAG: hypothetical protein ACI4M3_04680 [Acutalibacteraceae bacterium]
MWWTQNLTENRQKEYNSELTEISDNGTAALSGYGKDGCGEYHMAAPSGIAYAPPKGEQAVVVSTEAGTVCLGVLHENTERLEEGELMLYSAGGAVILLKNDGRVLINGREV